jgi:beta-propeller repeat-containing protein
MAFINRLVLSFLLILLLFTTSCKSQVTAPEIVDSESWERHLGSDKNDIGKDMVVTSNGIYITGVTLGELGNNQSAGEWDIFLTKYDFKGNNEWISQWGTEGRDSGNGIGADSTGIYITGRVSESLDNNIYYGKSDLFLTKFNFTGTKLWSIQIGSPEDDYGNGLAVDPSGIYVTGFTEGVLGDNRSAGKDDIFLIKFNSEGAVQWIRQWGTNNVDWGNDISIYNTEVFVTGFSQGDLSGNGSFGFDDIFLTKYSSEGIHQWTRQWGTENNDEGNSIISCSTGIYIAGRVNGDLDGNKRIALDDIFLTKYKQTGKRLWTKILGTKANDNAFAMAVSDEAVFITGLTYGEFKDNKSLGASDIYLARYSLSGEKQWITQLGTGGFDFGRAVSLADSDIYISGDTSFGIDNKKNTNDNRDIYLKKWRIFQNQ